jgi:hypothetical protein
MRVKRNGVIALGLLVAGCATEAVRTPQQAKDIALSSVCAKAQNKLDPGEKMPTEWVALRKDDRWHVFLPQDPSARFPNAAALKGAWINAKDGKIIFCEISREAP